MSPSCTGRFSPIHPDFKAYAGGTRMAHSAPPFRLSQRRGGLLQGADLSTLSPVLAVDLYPVARRRRLEDGVRDVVGEQTFSEVR